MKFYEQISKLTTDNVNIAFRNPTETADLFMNVIRVRNGLKVKPYKI